MRNKRKKCGAWILAFVMIFSLSGSAVWAVNDETDLSQEADTYVKPAASVLSKPSQDSDGYYILTTESELLWIADQVNNQKNTGLNVKLGNDLDLSAVCYEGADWEPIGTDSYPYSGIFDGCGYTISGLYGNLSGYTAGYGLFGTTSAATIRNLTVSGEITGDSSSYVGGIAGVSDQNTSFENCTNCVTIQISSGSYAFGGIVAELLEGTVTGCSNEADISGAQHTGGIVGYASGAEISGCSNSGSVTGSS
ncbi:MAG: hypothetical protein LUF32_09365 [Clostridiales bacterium]|nr:hypothetical protein [Clostridiales bacterium]